MSSGGKATVDATAEFFDQLGRRGHEPLLEKVTGTVGFDLANGAQSQRWRVEIRKGDIAVSRKNAATDCTFRAQKTLFDGIAGGEVNVVAAVLRGALEVEGDWRLMVLFSRLFPGPPTARKRRRVGARKQT